MRPEQEHTMLRSSTLTKRIMRPVLAGTLLVSSAFASSGKDQERYEDGGVSLNTAFSFMVERLKAKEYEQIVSRMHDSSEIMMPQQEYVLPDVTLFEAELQAQEEARIAEEARVEEERRAEEARIAEEARKKAELEEQTSHVEAQNAEASSSYSSGEITARITGYYCEYDSGYYGDGGGFCGNMASGVRVYEGAAACGSAYSIGSIIEISGYGRVVCEDRGHLDPYQIDVFTYYSSGLSRIPTSAPVRVVSE